VVEIGKQVLHVRDDHLGHMLQTRNIVCTSPQVVLYEIVGVRVFTVRSEGQRGASQSAVYVDPVKLTSAVQRSEREDEAGTRSDSR
jgi:hypothetical protein